MSRMINKTVKMLILTLMSTLILYASATVYYAINMQTTGTITAAAVYFDQGSDWTAAGGSMGTGNTYASLSINVYPNATLTYDQPLVINNTDASAHNVRLRHVSITPASATSSVSNFTMIDFTLNSVVFSYNTTGDTWNTPSNMGYQSLPATTAWDLKVETKAAAAATNGLTCTIVIAVDVQE